jgi:hypothetical protein
MADQLTFGRKPEISLDKMTAEQHEHPRLSDAEREIATSLDRLWV